jgi:hypothetical protein
MKNATAIQSKVANGESEILEWEVLPPEEKQNGAFE